MNSLVKIKITGKNQTTFIKELIRKKINIYQLEKNENSLEIIVSEKDYQLLKKKKSIYKIELIRYYGIARLKFLLKKYIIIIPFIILGISIIIFLSTRIWKIEIISPNQQLKSLLRNDLKKLGIKPYHRKPTYLEKVKIKEKILEKEHDKIEWLEIEESGTKYIIKVEEKKKNKTSKKCHPRHIVAKKNAIIMKIEATSGEIIKKKNDYVTKGDILISGWIHNKDTVVSKRCVNGKVFGEVWYKIKVLVPKTKIVNKETNKHSKRITLTIFNKKYQIPQKYPTSQKKQYNIIEDKIIPITLSITDYQKTEKITKKLTNKEIEIEGLKKAEQQLKKRLAKEESIISKKVLKKQQKNSKIEVDIFLKVKENITDYFDISNISIDEMNKKEE